MRWLLTLLALLTLAASPVTAAVAQARCHPPRPAAMAGMTMSGMDHKLGQKAADPCCDPGGHQKHGGKSCAQACAMASAASAALAPSRDSPVLAFDSLNLRPASVFASHTYEPPGLRRPPKPIA